MEDAKNTQMETKAQVVYTSHLIITSNIFQSDLQLTTHNHSFKQEQSLLYLSLS